MGINRGPTTYKEIMESALRERRQEQGRRYMWENMVNQPILKPAGEDQFNHQPNDALGAISSNTPLPAKLKDGVYEVMNVSLTRGLWDHIVEVDKNPRVTWERLGKGAKSLEGHGLDAPAPDETVSEKIIRHLKRGTLVTRSPLKVKVETNRDGSVSILCDTIPKNDAEFKLINQTLINLFKQQGVRRLVFDFPNAKPSQVDLKRVLMMLEMAQNSVPAVSIRLGDTIQKRLMMTSASKAERELMEKIKRIEAELKAKVNDPNIHAGQTKVAQEYLNAELQKNTSEVRVANDALNALLDPNRAPPATPNELKEAIKKLQEPMEKVKNNMDAIRQELDAKVSDDLAKKYQDAITAAKATLAGANAAATLGNNALVNHADAEVKAATQAATLKNTDVNEALDQGLQKARHQNAPHDERADGLLRDYETKLQQYEETAGNLMRGLNPAPDAQPVDVEALWQQLQARQTALETATNAISQEIDVLVQEGKETDLLQDRYYGALDASVRTTNAVRDHFAGLNAANLTNTQDAIKNKATALATQTEELNNKVTLNLQTGFQP